MNSNNPNKPATARLPSPKGVGRDIPTLVQQDIELRAKEGEEKYGERLTAFNGRKALVDAYQEGIDLIKYLRQQIEEDNWSLHPWQHKVTEEEYGRVMRKAAEIYEFQNSVENPHAFHQAFEWACRELKNMEGPLNHLKKEVKEIEDADYEDPEEYADAFLLLLDSARRAGIDLDKFKKEVTDKLYKNKTRSWPDGANEHQQDGDTDATRKDGDKKAEEQISLNEKTIRKASKALEYSRGILQKIGSGNIQGNASLAFHTAKIEEGRFIYTFELVKKAIKQLEKEVYNKEDGP